MSVCPSCQRPIAMARPRCLYCGAILPADLGAPPAASGGPAEARPAEDPAGAVEVAAPDRAALVVDVDGAQPKALVTGLGLSPYEAEQRVRRGGLQLVRLGPEDDVRAESERLRTAGLRTYAVPAARLQPAREPLLALGGRAEGASLQLRLETGLLQIAAAELLLVVRGPITREYQPDPAPRRLRTATLDPGYRFHLHRREESPPLELDPAAFEFEVAKAQSSSLLQLMALLEAGTAGVAVDDRFRTHPPALATAARAREQLLLGAEKASSRRTGAAILDNLAQFRFYSAWRGTVERGR